MSSSANLIDLIRHQLDAHSDKAALCARRDGRYVPLSYREVYEQIIVFSAALSRRGIQSGDRVAILSGNRPEWVISDMGSLALGAVSVPIYPTLSAPEIRDILNDCEAKAIVVETADHLRHIEAIHDDVDSLEAVLCLDTTLRSSLDYLTYFDDIVSGSHDIASIETTFQQTLDRIDRDQLASIVYTSGTTGTPKGVMLSHNNFLSNVEDILQALPLYPTDTVLSFLPLSHVFERTTGYYSVLAVGGTIYYADSIDTVGADLADVKPSILISVPRFYEKIYDRIMSTVTGLKKPLFRWALRVGDDFQNASANGSVSLGLAAQHVVAHRLVFSKVHARTGGRLRFFVSGGAPLRAEIGHFFRKVGFTIIEGYGLTETSPVISCNRIGDVRLGTVGLPLARVETRLSSDGELLVRGPLVMQGYWNKPSETTAVLDSDGWFHTGDVADIGPDGHITIVDRIKELIVLSNGKKVPPVKVEATLGSSPYISQIVVIGEQRNYLTALVVPNMDRISDLIGADHPVESSSETVSDSVLRDAFRSVIDELQVDLARFEQVKEFCLLSDEMTETNGLLTPTLKYKRRVIRDRYASHIDAMYPDHIDQVAT